MGLLAMLEAAFASEEEEEIPKHSGRQFVPDKEISETDMVMIDMLNSKGHLNVSYCVSDPDKPDLPIIFASDGFCGFTGYDRQEIEGKNCRFLQGPESSKDDVDRIRKAIKEKKETCVCILNYRKDKSKFINEFFISPLYDEDHKLAYFIGVQCAVPTMAPGQMPSNPGWIYSLGNHK